MRRFSFILLSLLAAAASTEAHIGSPDVYLDGKAGPYQLFVTVRPPVVIPGVAELEVRSASGGITTMRAVPLPMQGPGAKFAPIPDKLSVSPQDKQLFTGSLWMMAPGSWQVRVSVEGSQGSGSIAIPVPSAALTTKRMRFGLGALLCALGVFLVGGVVAMAGASVRESRLDPGVVPAPARVRSSRIAMAVAFAVVALALWGGNRWWNNEAASYGQDVYKPLLMNASVSSPGVLTLKLSDPGWLTGPDWRPLFTRSADDFVPDHGHLMHLYAIRQPGLDTVYHLHPELSGPGVFRLVLPRMPAGTYRLYADVVHANGFPETLVASMTLPQIDGRQLAGDDAVGSSTRWTMVSSHPKEFTLPDGYRMEWLGAPSVLRAKQPILFRFRLTKPDGSAPPDMAFYMGMLGHAAFVKTDGTVFAHIHPTGSVSMAAFMLAQRHQPADQPDLTTPPQQTTSMDMDGADMPGMSGNATIPALPDEVTFPYGFPSAGQYRVFVQMKHGKTIETGVFDASVT